MSTAQQINSVKCQSDSVNDNDLEWLVDAEPERMYMRYAPGNNVGEFQSLMLVTSTGQQWNWLVQCWLTAWKLVSHFPARVPVETVLYGRHSGKLLEKSEMTDMLEVSPPEDVMRSISASVV